MDMILSQLKIINSKTPKEQSESNNVYKYLSQQSRFFLQVLSF